MILALLAACAGLGDDSPGSDSGQADPCAGEAPLATCLSPTLEPDYYVAQSLAYFDTMDATVEDPPWPPYSELVARWEWPPWLKLTAFTRENIETTDALLRLYPSTVPERDCRYFPTQPFGRCRVVFRYEAHEDRPCPIYEEFTFNDAGEITWIEAWSDVDGLRPTTEEDPWGEQGDIGRLAWRVPGLGRPDGRIDLDGEEMIAAAEADADVADFRTRALDWYATWLEEYKSAGEEMWTEGCGW
ncbi:hypothetical protein L6R53_31575 [Myxococcota bacterium]|nr:hypothetical protein [Myxococcota bacterium]